MHLNYFEELESLLQLLAVLSLLTFAVSLVCIPLLVARLPRNYFLHRSDLGNSPSATISIGTVIVMLLRNLIGLALVAAGILMLFLPGQGVITMVIGIAVMSFPYKRKLLVGLTRPVSVRKSLDWLRRKMKKEPFYWGIGTDPPAPGTMG